MPETPQSTTPSPPAAVVVFARPVGGGGARVGQPSGGGGGSGTVTTVSSPTGEVGVATGTTTPKLSVAKVPSAALVAGTHVTVTTTGGKAKVSAPTAKGGTVTTVSSTDSSIGVTTSTTTPKLRAVLAKKHVQQTVTPNNGQALIYTSTAGLWVPKTISPTLTLVQTTISADVTFSSAPFAVTHVTLTTGTWLITGYGVVACGTTSLGNVRMWLGKVSASWTTALRVWIVTNLKHTSTAINEIGFSLTIGLTLAANAAIYLNGKGGVNNGSVRGGQTGTSPAGSLTGITAIKIG